jgi:hypothetical protein
VRGGAKQLPLHIGSGVGFANLSVTWSGFFIDQDANDLAS